MTPLVEMKEVSIAFGGVQAVDKVSIDLYPGEVVGLLGHNGAGKSTLIKMLSGAYKMDSGEIWINGQKASITSPRDVFTITAVGFMRFKRRAFIRWKVEGVCGQLIDKMSIRLTI